MSDSAGQDWTEEELRAWVHLLMKKSLSYEVVDTTEKLGAKVACLNEAKAYLTILTEGLAVNGIV